MQPSPLQTLLVGIVVLAIGHLLSKFVLEPIQEFWKVKGHIADALLYCANVYSNPGVGSHEDMEEAQKHLRQQATALLGAKNAIPLYGVWAFLRILPKREDLLSAHSNLIGLSNSVFKSSADWVEHNVKRVAHIASKLRLDIGEQ